MAGVPDYVFPSAEGGNKNECSYRRWMERAAEKADIGRTSFHKLQHSAISLLLTSGTDPSALQKLAGHSDVRITTQAYARLQEDEWLQDGFSE
jgi:integrase